MAVELRPATAVLLLAVVLAVGLVGSAVVTDVESDGQDPSVTRSAPLDDDDDVRLWLYTSRGPSFDRPTLPLNVVVYGDVDDVRRQLLERGRGDWNETGDEEQDIASDESVAVPNATAIEWEIADGARRYVYFVGADRGTWLSEHYQIHDGDYLGSRHHVRAYTSPGGERQWTAMQAHHEHWDWFQGRHVVTSVDKSQSYLEREFVDEPASPEIQRVPVRDGDRPVFDEWVTIVDYRDGESAVAAIFPLVVLGAFKTRLVRIKAAGEKRYPRSDVRALLLAAGVVALLTAVRLTGIELERSLAVPPKAIVLALYPLLVIGLPVITYLLARPLDRVRAFVGAAVGFLAALLVDYTSLGVSQVPLPMLVHAGALAVALGLIAAGASRTERRDASRVQHVRLGALLWFGAIVLPLLRFTPLPV